MLTICVYIHSPKMTALGFVAVLLCLSAVSNVMLKWAHSGKILGLKARPEYINSFPAPPALP